MSNVSPLLARKLLTNSATALTVSGVALLTNVVAIATGAYLHFSNQSQPTIINVSSPAAPLALSRPAQYGQFIIRSWIDLIALYVAQVAFGIVALPVARTLWLKVFKPVGLKLQAKLFRDSTRDTSSRPLHAANRVIRVEQINTSPPPYTP